LQNIRLLDLGTGSGCILLSCLHSLPDSVGVGVDLSNAALDIAIENATHLGLSDRAEFLLGNFINLHNIFELGKLSQKKEKSSKIL